MLSNTCFVPRIAVLKFWIIKIWQLVAISSSLTIKSNLVVSVVYASGMLPRSAHVRTVFEGSKKLRSKRYSGSCCSSAMSGYLCELVWRLFPLFVANTEPYMPISVCIAVVTMTCHVYSANQLCTFDRDDRPPLWCMQQTIFSHNLWWPQWHFVSHV